MKAEPDYCKCKWGRGVLVSGIRDLTTGLLYCEDCDKPYGFQVNKDKETEVRSESLGSDRRRFEANG